MKYLFIFILSTSMTTIHAQDGKAVTDKKTFSRTTSISQQINAPIETIWGLLTNAANMNKWNSTILSINGQIRVGEKIKLKSTLDPSRTFKLKVKEMQAPNKLVWGDAMGERVYLLTKSDEGVTFTMTEKIGGLLFPLFANKIPSFGEAFETFATDLKNTAESK